MSYIKLVFGEDSAKNHLEDLSGLMQVGPNFLIITGIESQLIGVRPRGEVKEWHLRAQMA